MFIYVDISTLNPITVHFDLCMSEQMKSKNTRVHTNE